MYVPPQFSVVTVVRNGVAHLADCLESVRSQRAVRLEHVVIDGASTDGTQDILRRYANGLAWWVSEPDGGIADAMNKGLRHATGDWLLFLNSDDYLASEHSLADAAAYLSHERSIVGFAIDFLHPDGSVRHVVPRPSGWWRNFKIGLLHQGTLIRRSLFAQLGEYDTRFRIAMDTEFFLRAHRNGVAISVHPETTLAVMRSGGAGSSTDWAGLCTRFAEERKAQLTQHPTAGWRCVYAGYWSLYLAYRRLRHLLPRN